LINQFDARVRLSKEPVAERPTRKRYDSKCTVYRSYGAFRAYPFRLFSHRLLQHCLHQTVNLDGVRVRVSKEQRMLQDLAD
jgi:hypothetical protein